MRKLNEHDMIHEIKKRYQDKRGTNYQNYEI